jgi:flagellum-specific peptidoglycan hydrolase FlgJ
VRSIAGEATWSDWRWGVPASITIAQAILESNWGRSAPGHNLFGLKGTGPAGSAHHRVVEYRRGRRSRPSAPFRLYDEPAQAVRDHGAILGESRRYARARSGGEDIERFAAGLVGVYATDPRYQGKLLRLVALYGLDALDVVTAAPWGAPVEQTSALR